jgi:ABC-type proline/glycine betaine transport system permease subunit
MIDRVLMVLGSLMAFWCGVGLLLLYGLAALALGAGFFAGSAVAIAAAEDRRERQAMRENGEQA